MKRVRLPRSVLQICKDNELDPQILDSSLNEQELLNQLKEMGFGRKKPYQKDEVEAIEKMALEEERKFLMKEREREYEQLKKCSTLELEKYYYDLKLYLNILVDSNEINGLIVRGKAGIGKTFQIIKYLVQMNKKFEFFCGSFSPLELYHILYAHKKDKILIFDDCLALLKNSISFSILLSALYSPTPKRLVMWHSTSKKLKAPEIFEFNSKVIIITNEVPKNIEPFISRCLNFELNFDYDTILKLMVEIAKLPHKKLTKEERFMIVDWIKEQTRDKILENFDLRLQQKIELVYQFDKQKWKELASKIIKEDEYLSIIGNILQETENIKKAIKRFNEQTGLCARTFWRYKQKFKYLFPKSI